MNLCLPEHVKDRLVITNDAHDFIVGQLIAEVSAEIEEYLNRGVQTQSSVTEQLDVHFGEHIFWLKYFPVTSVTDVRIDSERSFGSTTIVLAADYYISTSSGNNGRLVVDKAYLTPGPGYLQVNYAGGMALTTEAFMTAFPAITGACSKEVAYRYQRRSNPGQVNMSAGGAAVTLANKDQFLASVKQALLPHRRENEGNG